MTNKTITDLTPASALDGTEIIAVTQGGNSRKLPLAKFTTVDALVASSIAYANGWAEGDVIEAGGFRYEVAASGASDEHLTTAGGVKLYLLPAEDGSYRPAMLGIDATGAEIVTDEWRVLIAAAGASGVIKGDPGATYLIDGVLEPLAGQSLLGNGATFKRANEVTSATSTSIGTGASPTTITVTDATSFRVGSHVTVTNAGTTDPTYHEILSISGNDLSVATNFSQAFASGGTVVSAYPIIRSTANDVIVEGWEFDGNSANWGNAGRRWENEKEVALYGDRSRITNNYIHDAPVEAIEFGGDGTRVDKNTILNIGGNGIHASGASEFFVCENRIENTQQWASEDPGHQDGCMTFSNLVSDGFISGNVLKNGKSGFGSLDQADNSEHVFRDNVVVDCDTPFDFTSASDGISEIVIVGNRFDSCGLGDIQTTTASPTDDTERHTKIRLEGNVFTDTRIRTHNVRHIRITGNDFFLGASMSAVIALYIEDTRDCKIIGNVVEGGNYGVYLNSTLSGDDNIEICGNRAINQVTGGIRVQTFAGDNIDVSGNTVASGADSSSSYIAILDNAGKGAVRNNNVNVQTGTDGILCKDNGTYTGNRVITGGSANSIKTYGGSSGIVIVNNFVDVAVSNGGGVSNTVENNYVF